MGDIAEQEGRRGKIVVLEGIDGSGKGTQHDMVLEFLRTQGIPFTAFDFPRYGTPEAEDVERYLRGEFGPLESIDPRDASKYFARDRVGALPEIRAALDRGEFVVMNRYVTSNLGHQTGRLPREEWDEFVDEVIEDEYEKNGLPREDTVVYLFVPWEVASENIMRKNERAYTKGQKRDILEQDEHLRTSQGVYDYLAERFPHWVKVICVDDEGNMRTPDEIHGDVIEVFRSKGMIPAQNEV